MFLFWHFLQNNLLEKERCYTWLNRTFFLKCWSWICHFNSVPLSSVKEKLLNWGPYLNKVSKWFAQLVNNSTLKCLPWPSMKLMRWLILPQLVTSFKRLIQLSTGLSTSLSVNNSSLKVFPWSEGNPEFHSFLIHDIFGSTMSAFSGQPACSSPEGSHSKIHHFFGHFIIYPQQDLGLFLTLLSHTADQNLILKCGRNSGTPFLIWNLPLLLQCAVSFCR